MFKLNSGKFKFNINLEQVQEELYKKQYINQHLFR